MARQPGANVFLPWPVLVLALGCDVPRRPPALPADAPSVAYLMPSDVAGHGRVWLDVLGDSARVEVVDHRDYAWGTPEAAAAEFSGGLETTRGERVRPVCERTPCVLDMPFGTYELRFTQGPRRDTTFVTFGPTPSLAVHAVGDRRPEHTALSVCAGVLAAASAITIPLGSALAVTAPPPDAHQDPNDRRTVGLTLAGIGALATVGAVACLLNGSEVDRSGPVRQWTAPGSP